MLVKFEGVEEFGLVFWVGQMCGHVCCGQMWQRFGWAYHGGGSEGGDHVECICQQAVQAERSGGRVCCLDHGGARCWSHRIHWGTEVIQFVCQWNCKLVVFYFSKANQIDPHLVALNVLKWLMMAMDGGTQLNQLETLMRGSVSGLGKDAILQYSQLLAHQSKRSKLRKFMENSRYFLLDNWKRLWIMSLWISIMAGLFVWKFIQYRNRTSFQVMGYCICVAKGAAETLKLNMALILLPVCRNTLTWLRSTWLGSYIPFDDNLDFHKVPNLATDLHMLRWEHLQGWLLLGKRLWHRQFP